MQTAKLYLRGKRLFFLYLLPFGTKSFLPKIKCFSSLPPLMLRFSCIFTIKTEMHRKTIIFADFYINFAVKIAANRSLTENELGANRTVITISTPRKSLG